MHADKDYEKIVESKFTLDKSIDDAIKTLDRHILRSRYINYNDIPPELSDLLTDLVKLRNQNLKDIHSLTIPQLTTETQD